MPLDHSAPGVYPDHFTREPRQGLRTGVPAFLGLAREGPVRTPREIDRWTGFESVFGAAYEHGYLAEAVRGFFRNGGDACVVVRLEDPADEEMRGELALACVSPGETLAECALRRGLAALEVQETVDLVCAPDVLRELVPEAMRGSGASGAEPRDRALPAALRMQQEVLRHCDRTGDRLALLDSLPGAGAGDVLQQREALAGANGALYYPWLRVDDPGGWAPPCGYVAGIYARTDRQVGVHKAPANERVEGVLDLEVALDDAAQGELNQEGVNCLRAFRGRGIRVWGARTLSREAAWRYVNVRRVFLTLGRWIARALPGAVFEPNGPLLWARIGREIGGQLAELYRRGALQGRTPEEAFYVRCDASTNPPEVRDAGMVVTEVGIAPALPNEFVIVRFTHGAGGVDIAGPTGPA